MKHFTILLILAFSAWTTTYALPVVAPEVFARFDSEFEDVEIFKRQNKPLRPLKPKPATTNPTPGSSNQVFHQDPSKGGFQFKTENKKAPAQQQPAPGGSNHVFTSDPTKNTNRNPNKKPPIPGTNVFNSNPATKKKK